MIKDIFKRDDTSDTRAPVMLLAAGFGTRMRPLTDTLPKPLIPIAGHPQIDYTVALFKAYGCEKMIVNAHYLPEKIHHHFSNSASVTISDEAEILETGGGVKKALDLLKEEFYVSNTDSILLDDKIGLDDKQGIIHKIEKIWDESTDAVLAVIEKDKAVGYAGTGDFSMAEDGTLSRDKNGAYVFIGFQKLRKSLFDTIEDASFSLNVVYSKALEKGTLKGVVHTGEWYHISTPEDVAHTQKVFQERGLSEKIWKGQV